MSTSEKYDAIVVGGGPAGLSAALVLARCRRRVLVCDAGRPRNRGSRAMHNFLGRDGSSPLDLLRAGREEVRRAGAEVLDDEVEHAKCVKDGDTRHYELRTRSGMCLRSRTLILATGVTDRLPEVGDAERFYGKGLYVCPYCDGYEHREGRLLAYGTDETAAPLAMSLLTWSSDVVLCTNGSDLPPERRTELESHGVRILNERIERFEGAERLTGVRLADGTLVECAAVFFKTGKHQSSELARMLGCEVSEKEEARSHEKQRAGRDGLYLAGDVDGNVQFAIVAAAEGAIAAVAVNEQLSAEGLRQSFADKRP